MSELTTISTEWTHDRPVCPLRRGDPADATASASSLPGHHGVIDEPDRSSQNRRPEGEHAAGLQGQADHDLAVSDVRELPVQEMRRTVTQVPRRTDGAQEPRLASEVTRQASPARREIACEGATACAAFSDDLPAQRVQPRSPPAAA